jgi:hypothetical protein
MAAEPKEAAAAKTNGNILILLYEHSLNLPSLVFGLGNGYLFLASLDKLTLKATAFAEYFTIVPIRGLRNPYRFRTCTELLPKDRLAELRYV